MVYVQVYVPGMERILQHFSWTRPYSHPITARSRILSIHLPTTFISPQKAETLLRKMNVWIQWHDIPKIQRLADWQHPIFFGPAPMDGLDVQMDVRLLANQIRRSFSQRSQPEELIEARVEMRDEMRNPQGSPTASGSLVQFQWEFIFANLPGGTPDEHFAINTGDGNAVDLQYWIHRSVFVLPWLAISEPQTQDWFVPKALVPNSTWLKDFESTTQTPHGNVSLTSWSWMLVVTLEHLNVENKRYPKTDLKYGHHIFI